MDPSNGSPNAALQTSLITILSTDHGRLRREQRNIAKRDLQKALKYGTHKRTKNDRWRIEYDGIVFITDSTKTKEITAFPAPIKMAPTTPDMIFDLQKAKSLHQLKPSLSSSHSVFLIDNSQSMQYRDIPMYKDRLTAAYSVSALDFVGNQLLNGTSNNRDLLSLIEFDRTARVIFSREPLSWITYNKLLSRRETKPVTLDTHPQSSNYLPALELARTVLREGDHGEQTLILFFLSDGEPSDAEALGISEADAGDTLCDMVCSIQQEFGRRLSSQFVGIGGIFSDFSALRRLQRKLAETGGNSQWRYCGKNMGQLAEAVSEMATTLQDTRTTIQRCGGLLQRRTVPFTQNQWHFHKVIAHFVWDAETDELLASRHLLHGIWNKSEIAVPHTLSIQTVPFGEGVERFAYRCQATDSDGSRTEEILGAKETSTVERVSESMGFHCSFLKAQHIASYLADMFNVAAADLNAPKLSVLPCCVFVVEDDHWPDSERALLVEKMLPLNSWVKWNNNAGGVDGNYYHQPLNLEAEFHQLNHGTPGLQSVPEEEDKGPRPNIQSSFCRTNTVSDLLQAFSHFSYLFSNKELLVCDLQGAFNESNNKIELTDPAIHSSFGNFGRTNKGEWGMNMFLKTHQCGPACEKMLSSREKSNWGQQWLESKSRLGL